MAFISLLYKEINAIKVLNISAIDQYSEWNIDNRLQLKSRGRLIKSGRLGRGIFGEKQLTDAQKQQAAVSAATLRCLPGRQHAPAILLTAYAV